MSAIFKRFILAIGLSLLPALASAACHGTDMRADLSPAERTEIAQAVALEPFAHGNLWEATRDGKTITLVGTVHLDDPRLVPILEDLETRLSSANLLFLEMTSREQERLQSAIATRPDLILLEDQSLIELLPPETWHTLRNAAEARGLPGPAAARLQPWYLSLVLALPPCILAAGEIQGLDAQIEALADRAGVPKLPLEDYDTLFTVFAEEPLDMQLRFLTASLMDEETTEDMLATTLNAYFEEASAELWHLARVTARGQINLDTAEIDRIFDELEVALLVKRNHAWIDRLTAVPDENIIAAFGAAHLFGEDGVLRLLEAEGFELVRLTR